MTTVTRNGEKKPSQKPQENLTATSTAGKSWQFLTQNKSLLWMPISSLFLSLIVFGLLALFILNQISHQNFNGSIWQFHLLIGTSFVVIVLAYCVNTFFAGSTIYYVYQHIKGNPISISEAMFHALKSWKGILIWSLITATLGKFLSLVERSHPRIGLGLIETFIGVSWRLTEFLSLPAMIINETGPIESIKQTFKGIKTGWRRTLMNATAITMGFFLLLVIGFLGFTLSSSYFHLNLITSLIVFLVYILMLSIFRSCLFSIFRAFTFVDVSSS